MGKQSIRTRIARAKRSYPSGPCPRCGATDTLPILYGWPDVEMLELESEGQIVLGGCVLRPEAWQCRECKARWEPATRRVERTTEWTE
jgi:hypothetical protein